VTKKNRRCIGQLGETTDHYRKKFIFLLLADDGSLELQKISCFDDQRFSVNIHYFVVIH
jgi:hypothetical protein